MIAYSASAILILAGFATAAMTNHPGIAMGMVVAGIAVGSYAMAVDPSVGD